LLYRWRRQIGVPYRLLFSNGGPCHPPFNRTDFVHQVAPLYLEEAISAGEPQTKHFLVPYGIRVPTEPQMDASGKRMLRAKLGLPQDRAIVLSVGWISRQHKRMHYVIEELAQLPEPRPFLLLVGAMDESSHEILKLAHDLLGEGNFRALTVTYQEVPNFYRASDLFVLASLQEGFGRVYLEALMHGLPTIGHRHPVIEYVLGDVGILADLSVPGNLTPVIRYQLSLLQAGEAHQNRVLGRIEEVRKRFSWEVLQPQYVQMFRDCATMPLLRNQS
jgi:glycosyltransferase involved in cell wall biosynthesis